MKQDTERDRCHSNSALCGALLGDVHGPRLGAGCARDRSPCPASEPSPYYIGVSQGFTHESNVFRTPNGTQRHLLDDQPAGRLRPVDRSAARLRQRQCQRQSLLQDHEQARQHRIQPRRGPRLADRRQPVGQSERLVGAQPGATRRRAASCPCQVRNESQTEAINATRALGRRPAVGRGCARVLRASTIRTPDYLASESSTKTASLGVNYRPGGPLRLGVAVRGHAGPTRQGSSKCPNQRQLRIEPGPRQAPRSPFRLRPRRAHHRRRPPQLHAGRPTRIRA